MLHLIRVIRHNVGKSPRIRELYSVVSYRRSVAKRLVQAFVLVIVGMSNDKTVSL